MTMSKWMRRADVKDGIKPVNVMLTVTCQIIDFEPTELKKFEAAAP